MRLVNLVLFYYLPALFNVVILKIFDRRLKLIEHISVFNNLAEFLIKLVINALVVHGQQDEVTTQRCLSCHGSKHPPSWCFCEKLSPLHSVLLGKVFLSEFPVMDRKLKRSHSIREIYVRFEHTTFWVTGREGILHHVEQIIKTVASSRRAGHVYPCCDEPRMTAFRLDLQSSVCCALTASIHMQPTHHPNWAGVPW